MGQIKMRHYGTSANNKGSDGGDRNFIKSSLKVFYRLGARSVFTLFSLIFDFSILLLTISGLFLFQLSHKPMKLDFLTSAIETRLNIALGDNLRAEFKGVSLRFGEGVNGGRLNLLLRGVSLFDSSNTNIASAPIAEISVKAKYKDGKMLMPSRLVLIRPTFIFVRQGNDKDKKSIFAGKTKTINLADLTPKKIHKGQPPWLTQSLRVMAAVTNDVASTFTDGTIGELGIDRGTLIIDNLKTGRKQRFRSIDVSFKEGKKGLKANISAWNNAKLWQMELIRSGDNTNKDQRLELSVDGIDAGFFAAMLASNDARQLLLPLSGRADLKFNYDGLLLAANSQVKSDSGYFKTSNLTNKIDDFNIKAYWSHATNKLIIQKSRFASQLVSFGLFGFFDFNTDDNDITSDDNDFTWGINADGIKIFSKALDTNLIFDKLIVRATTKPAINTIDLNKIEISRLGLKLGGGLTVTTNDNNRRIAFNVHSDPIDINGIKSLWPNKLLRPWRLWIENRVLKGKIQKGAVNGQLEIANNQLSLNRVLAAMELAGSLKVDGLTVKATPSAPVMGSLDTTISFSMPDERVKLKATSFKLPSGRIIKVSDTVLAMTKGNDSKRIVNAFTRISGKASSFAELAGNIPHEYDFVKLLKPQRVKGDIMASVNWNGPVEYNNEQSKAEIKINGKNIALQDKLAGQSLDDANLAILFSDGLWSMDGDARINGFPFKFKHLKNNQSGIEIVGNVNNRLMRQSSMPDFIKSIGNHVNGRISVRISDTSIGRKVDVDLKPVAIYAPALGIKKPKGRDAYISFYANDDNSINNVRFLIDEFKASSGTIKFNKESLASMKLNNFAIAKGDNSRLSVSYNNSWRFRLTGNQLTLTPILSNLDDFNTGKKSSSIFPLPALNGEVRIKRLLGAKNLRLNNLHLKIISNKAGLQYAEARALRASKTLFTLKTLGKRQTTGKYLRLATNDFGHILRFIGISNDIIGGTGTISYTFKSGGINDKTNKKGQINLNNMTFLRRTGDGADARKSTSAIKSYAVRIARKGIKKTTKKLNNSNTSKVNFDSVKADFSYLKNRITVNQLQAYNSLFGVSAAGVINSTNGRFNVKGTFIPLYAINTTFSYFPFIGTLLGGRVGEGLIGLTFQVDGNVNDFRWGINPLSAIAPGILRLMMEYNN